MMPLRSGANHPNWKGGRVIDPRGYVLIRVGKDHPLADVRGYAYEHRIFAERYIGRKLKKGEEIHHKGERSNNAQDMIAVTKSRADHKALHRKRTDLRQPDDSNPLIKCACGCGTAFLKYDQSNRPRIFANGHNRRHRD